MIPRLLLPRLPPDLPDDEKYLRSRYHAWPEDQRGYFVLKVPAFANKLRYLNHPDVEFVVNGPLTIKEIDR